MFFDVSAAFLAAFFAFSATPFAFDLALSLEAVATFLTVFAAFAALRTLPAMATLRPAFCNLLGDAFATIAMLVSFAAFNFLAVAAPTPGRDVRSSFFELPLLVMSSPVCPCPTYALNLLAIYDEGTNTVSS